MEKLTRPSNEHMDNLLGLSFGLLDHGHIRVIDYMGDEAAIVQAARVSYGAGTKTVNEDRGLLRYLMRHHHTTPFEMCEIKMHVKLPVFVARQWIRHRMANVNEVSARYSILAREFYMPEPDALARQDQSNKQGRDQKFTPYSDMAKKHILEDIRDIAEMAFNTYDRLSDPEGVELTRELARVVLPLNTYTEWYWKIDLHNLLHFLRLRADPHAQMEIRVYANVICEIVQGWMPNVWEAFEDYVLHAETFSRQEMVVIRQLAAELQAYGDFGDYSEDLAGLSSRELKDFRRKLGITD